MTNEEKARMDSYLAKHFIGEAGNLDSAFNEGWSECAEWKDQQFKERLEEKRKHLYNRYDFIGNNAVVCRVLLDEIIDELFPEKENQDTTDNDE